MPKNDHYDKKWVPGQLALSLMGHDKGRVYVVLQSEGERLYVADGMRRTLERPKLKSFKHVQKIPISLERLLENVQMGSLTDGDIKKAIKTYKLMMKDQEE